MDVVGRHDAGGRQDQMDTPDDDLLLEALRAGSDDAFALIFERHAELIYNFAHRRSADWDLADEIVSATLLEMWRQRESVHTTDGSLRPWLLGVAHNQLRRHWRTATRKGRALDRLQRQPAIQSGHDAAVVDQLEADARLAGVLASLDELPADQRDVLLLWAWEELSYAEIAATLDISIGTVRSRLSRARRRLATLTEPSPLGTAGELRSAPPAAPDDRPIATPGSSRPAAPAPIRTDPSPDGAATTSASHEERTR